MRCSSQKRSVARWGHRGDSGGTHQATIVHVFRETTVYFNRRGFYPPGGSPLIYAIAMSWLIAITALPISAVFKLSPKLFSLARWEKEGAIYDRTSIRAFRWVLLHSPLGWINPALHLGASRTDCERLLREMNVSEGVHWLTCFLSSILAISYLVGGYVVYGYVMLLIRVPFDLSSHHAPSPESRSSVSSVESPATHVRRIGRITSREVRGWRGKGDGAGAEKRTERISS